MPALLDVPERQVQELHRRLVTREMTPGLDDLPELTVETLDRVGRRQDAPDLGWVGKCGDHVGPQPPPERRDRRVALALGARGEAREGGLRPGVCRVQLKFGR